MNFVKLIHLTMGSAVADRYEYGTIGTGLKARRSIRTGKVEFELWKPGEQGHADGYWHIVGSGWETTFVVDTSVNKSIIVTVVSN